MVQGTIEELEAQFKQKKDPDTLTELLLAYISSQDAKKLQVALSLGMSHLKMFPDHPKFLRRLSEVLLYIKDDPGAQRFSLELAERALRLAPDDPVNYAYLGYVSWRLGLLSIAVERTKQALSMLEKRKQAGALGDAESEFESLLRANLAYYLAEIGDPTFGEQARELATVAYRTHPSPSRADTLGYVLMKFAKEETDLRQAEQYFLEARKTAGENPFIDQHLQEVRKRLSKEKT